MSEFAISTKWRFLPKSLQIVGFSSVDIPKQEEGKCEYKPYEGLEISPAKPHFFSI
jgi:hypothetical protein